MIWARASLCFVLFFLQPRTDVWAQGAIQSPWVRRDIANLKSDGPEFTALRKAILKMQHRKPNDPTSWDYQTNIHGSQCQHGTFFFLAWHRMYLYYFERILREASGDPKFSIPYWNYASENRIPQPFLENTEGNPLYISNRCTAANNGTAFPKNLLSKCEAFSFSNFSSIDNSGQSFGGQEHSPTHDNKPHGQLEKAPHDVIHGLIGGPMRFAETAAEDPLFLVHHANIDRLWQEWIDAPHELPTNNAAWMDTKFTFYDVGGKLVKKSAREILQTARDLGYIYEPPAVNETCSPAKTEIQKTSRHSTWLKTGVVQLRPERPSVAIPISAADQRNVKEFLINEPEATIQIDIAYRLSRFMNGPIDVFVNLPPGEPIVPRQEFYAGSLSSFGTKSLGWEVQTLDLSNVLRSQIAKGLWNRPIISVSLVRSNWDCSNRDGAFQVPMFANFRFRARY